MPSFVGDRRVARHLHFLVEVSDDLHQRNNWMGLCSIWYSKGKAVDFSLHVEAVSFFFFAKVIPPYTKIKEKRMCLVFPNLEGPELFAEERLSYPKSVHIYNTDYLVHRNAEMWCSVFFATIA